MMKTRKTKSIRDARLERILKKWERTRPDRAALELFMTDMLELHKKAMVESRAVRGVAALLLLDNTAKFHVIDLDHLEDKELYEAVPRLCSEHRALVATFVVPSVRMICDRGSITPVRESHERVSHELEKEIYQSDLSATISATIMAEVPVEVRRCVYAYGATETERLTLTMSYVFTRNDPESIRFDNPFEEDGVENIVTPSGTIIPIASLFDGVNWGSLMTLAEVQYPPC